MLRFFYKTMDGYLKIILVTTLCFTFVSSCYRYSAWNDAGIYDTNVADQWIAAGFNNPIIAAKWQNDGFNPEDAKTWKNAGFTDSDVAKKWKDDDFNSQEAIAWKSAGFADSDKAKSWEIAGFNAQEASNWDTSKFVTSIPWEQIKRQISRHLPQAIKADSSALVIVTPASVATMWKAQGFDPQKATAWQNAGFDPFTAEAWKDVGFSLNEARVWKDTGFNSKEAKRLRDLGLSPQLAIQKREKEKQALLRNPRYKSLVKKTKVICEKIQNLQSNSQCFWTFGEIMDRGENSLLLRGMALPLNKNYNIYGSNTKETNILIVEPNKSGIKDFESYMSMLSEHVDQYQEYQDMFFIIYVNKIASNARDEFGDSFYSEKHRFIKKSWGKNAFGGDVPVWVYGDIPIPQSTLDKCNEFKDQLARFGTKEFPNLGSKIADSCDCEIPSCN